MVDISTCPFLRFQNGFPQRRTNCFANCCVQAVLSLKSSLIQFDESNAVDKFLQDLFKREAEKFQSSLDLTPLRKLLGFDDFRQHDVDEFFGKLLANCGSHLRKLFAVKSTSKAHCSACNFDKQADSSIREDFIIRLFAEDKIMEWKSLAELSGHRMRSCLNAQCSGVGKTVTEFDQYEILEGTQFVCLSIPLMDGTRRMIERSIKGFSPGKVTLKYENFKGKVCSFKGQLQSVICHYGDGMDRGHYIAYRPFESDWYLIDDQAICYRKTSRLPQCMKDFYVLILQRN